MNDRSFDVWLHGHMLFQDQLNVHGIPSHWRLEKKRKPLFLERSSFFHTEIAEIAIRFFCALQLAYTV